MRIIANFTANTEPVLRNDLQKNLNSYIHKCLGQNNEYHDKYSDYNVSSLLNGTIVDGNMEYPNGGKIVISSPNIEILNKLMIGISSNPDLFSGMKYINVDFISENFYSGINHFFTLSPILLRDKDDRYITITDDMFDEYITKRTLNKLKIYSDKNNLNLSFRNFKITTARKNGKERVEKIMVKNVCNRASRTIISINCNRKVAELIYNLGLGQSTGSGFGCLCTVESIKSYKSEIYK